MTVLDTYWCIHQEQSSPWLSSACREAPLETMISNWAEKRTCMHLPREMMSGIEDFLEFAGCIQVLWMRSDMKRREEKSERRFRVWDTPERDNYSPWRMCLRIGRRNFELGQSQVGIASTVASYTLYTLSMSKYSRRYAWSFGIPGDLMLGNL